MFLSNLTFSSILCLKYQDLWGNIMREADNSEPMRFCDQNNLHLSQPFGQTSRWQLRRDKAAHGVVKQGSQ